MITNEQAVDLIRQEIAKVRFARIWCAAHGLQDSVVSEMLHGKRPVGGRVMDALGLKQVIYYEPVG